MPFLANAEKKTLTQGKFSFLQKGITVLLSSLLVGLMPNSFIPSLGSLKVGKNETYPNRCRQLAKKRNKNNS